MAKRFFTPNSTLKITLPSRREILENLARYEDISVSTAAKRFIEISAVSIVAPNPGDGCELCGGGKNQALLELSIHYDMEAGGSNDMPFVCCLDRPSCQLRAAVRSECKTAS